MSRHRHITLALILLSSTGACEDDGSSAPRDIPISIAIGSGGATRFFVTFELGNGDPMTAMLDTGSTGLRLLRSAVSGSVLVDSTDEAVEQDYESGLQLDGVKATARFTIGDLQTDDPIPLMLIDGVSCTTAECPATGQTVDTFTFNGAPAILGVGMRTSIQDDGIGNPIAQLPNRPSYIVEAPSYGGSAGVLRVGPSEDDLTRFAATTTSLEPYDSGALLGNGVRAWDDHAIATCVTPAPLPSFCAGALLDTGDPPIALYATTHSGSDVQVPSGSRVDVQIGSLGDLGDVPFVVGANPLPGVDEVAIKHSSTDNINLGTFVFYNFDVWFDQPGGHIGLFRHPGT